MSADFFPFYFLHLFDFRYYILVSFQLIFLVNFEICKAMLNHWETALYKCIVIILVKHAKPSTKILKLQ